MENEDRASGVFRFLPSKLLTVIKVPMMISVILVHCRPDYIVPVDNVGVCVIKFINTEISPLCISLFFVISGILFFRDGAVGIREKLKRRFYTLLLPYILWNIFGLLITQCKMSFFSSVFPAYDVRLTPLEYLVGFWDTSLVGLPMDYPWDFVLWFVRDLIVAVPIVALASRVIGLRLWVLAPLYVLVVLFGAKYSIVNSIALYYAGGILGNFLYAAKDVDCVKIKRALSVIGICGLMLYMAYAVARMFAGLNLQLLAFPVTLLGILGMFTLTDWVISRFNIEESKLIKNALFFIYACHGLWTPIANRLSSWLIAPTTTVSCLICYALTFFIFWYGDLLAYILVRRISPKLASVLSGRRG